MSKPAPTGTELVHVAFVDGEAFVKEIAGAPLPPVLSSLRILAVAKGPGGRAGVALSIDTPEGRVCYTLPAVALVEASREIGRKLRRTL